jgi:hypothetical protein
LTAFSPRSAACRTDVSAALLDLSTGRLVVEVIVDLVAGFGAVPETDRDQLLGESSIRDRLPVLTDATPTDKTIKDARWHMPVC